MNKASDKAKSGGKKQLSGRIIKSLNKISGELVAGLALSKPSASPAASPPPKPPTPNRTANREKLFSSSFTSKNRHVSHSFTIGYDILYTQKAILPFLFVVKERRRKVSGWLNSRNDEQNRIKVGESWARTEKFVPLCAPRYRAYNNRLLILSI